MKLNELIKTLPKNTYLKIHAVNGSSHIYCWKNSQSALEKVNHYLTLNSQRLVRKAEKKLNNLEKYTEYGLEHLKGINKENAKKIKMKRSKEVLTRLIKERKWNINNNILDREVIDYYNGIVDREKPTIIINISGYEVGNHWTIDDFSRELKRYGLR